MYNAAFWNFWFAQGEYTECNDKLPFHLSRRLTTARLGSITMLIYRYRDLINADRDRYDVEQAVFLFIHICCSFYPPKIERPYSILEKTIRSNIKNNGLKEFQIVEFKFASLSYIKKFKI